ncbi:MAG: hypothetical protein ABI678_28675 [Kofleriaceae bacterium]
MEIFGRINPPYKSVSQATAAHPSIASRLTGFFGSLFGASAPVYQSVDGQGAYAPASSGFWSMFGGSTPPYKIAPATTDGPLDDTGTSVDDDSGACAPGPDEIVVL